MMTLCASVWVWLPQEPAGARRSPQEVRPMMSPPPPAWPVPHPQLPSPQTSWFWTFPVKRVTRQVVLADGRLSLRVAFSSCCTG